MQKILFVLTPIVILGALYGAQRYHSRSLEHERARVNVAVAATQHALKIAADNQRRAAQAQHAADSIAAVRRQRAPARAAVVAAAPDTCRPAIAALEAEKAELKDENSRLRSAFDDQKKATAALTPTTKELAEAAHDLSRKSGGSFWRDITPKLGVGATVGLSTTGGVAAVVGPTLHWDF